MSNTSNENSNKDMALSVDELKRYAPVAFIVGLIFIQFNLFATPTDLNNMRNDIMETMERKYATKSDTTFLKEQVGDMKVKIDKIYDKMIGNNK